MFLCSLRYCLKCYFSKGVYSFICVCIYIYIYIYIYICVCVCVCVCMNVFIYMYICVCVCMSCCMRRDEARTQVQENVCFNNKLKQKPSQGGKTWRQAGRDDTHTTQHLTLDNETAQDCRHQENKWGDNEEGNEEHTGGVTETIMR